MNIVMNEEARSSVNTRDMVFRDLYLGDVFMDVDKELYVRTEPFVSEFETYNAINLKNGALAYFVDDEEKVWKYEGSVVFDSNAFNNKVAI